MRAPIGQRAIGEGRRQLAAASPPVVIPRSAVCDEESAFPMHEQTEHKAIGEGHQQLAAITLPFVIPRSVVRDEESAFVLCAGSHDTSAGPARRRGN